MNEPHQIILNIPAEYSNDAKQIIINIPADYSWLIALVTLFGIVLGFIGVLWRLGKQHESALKVQEEQHQNTLAAQQERTRDRLHLEIYREIAEAIASCSGALTEFGIYILMFPSSLKIRIKYSTATRDHGQGDYTRERFSELKGKASEGMLHVMAIMEKYEIALPGFGTFKERLGTQSCKFLNANDKLYGKIALLISWEGPNQHNISPPLFPDEKGLAELDKITKEIFHIQTEIQAVLWDLRIESQNHLLGNLFENRVPPRMPSDATIEAPEVDNNRKADIL